MDQLDQEENLVLKEILVHVESVVQLDLLVNVEKRVLLDQVVSQVPKDLLDQVDQLVLLEHVVNVENLDQQACLSYSVHNISTHF